MPGLWREVHIAQFGAHRSAGYAKRKDHEDCMSVLSDPEVRRKAAEIVVWGKQPRRISRQGIQKRVEDLLERLENKKDILELEDDDGIAERHNGQR
jgi:hypothetical protein